MKEQEKLEKSRKTISQYKRVFSSSDGRAVLYDLMRSNFLLASTPHVPGDTESTFKNIGKQELVKTILHLLKMDPEQFLALTNEQEGSHV